MRMLDVSWRRSWRRRGLSGRLSFLAIEERDVKRKHYEKKNPDNPRPQWGWLFDLNFDFPDFQWSPASLPISLRQLTGSPPTQQVNPAARTRSRLADAHGVFGGSDLVAWNGKILLSDGIGGSTPYCESASRSRGNTTSTICFVHE